MCTRAVIVEAPVNGSDAANVRFSAWQFRQILGRGVHGIRLCQAQAADAVHAFWRILPLSAPSGGVDPSPPSLVERIHGATRDAASSRLGLGTRGRGSEMTTAAIWGLSPEDYVACCDPWPLSRHGELLLGSSWKAPRVSLIARRSSRRRGRLCRNGTRRSRSLSLGYVTVPRDPYPPEMQQARACLRGVPQTPHRVSRDGHAGEHYRQAQ